MTYEQLRVLRAIVQTGTFRAAAEQMHKSQPAISAMMGKLESSLGFSLLSREGYRPELTEAGRLFYEQALVSLGEMNRLDTLARSLSGDEEIEVRLAVNQVCPLPVVLDTLKKIDARFPLTQFIMTTESVGGAINRLKQGETDIAITTESGIDVELMEARPFDVVRVVPVARPDYGPAARGGKNTASDLRDDVQVLVADSSVTGEKQSLDVIPQARHWTVTDVAAKKEIILAGMGWGGLPEHCVADELASGELVQVRVAGFDTRRSALFIVRRTDSPIGMVADTLWNALGDIAVKSL